MKKRSRERCHLTPYPHSLLPAFSTPFYSIFQQPFFAMIHYFSEIFSPFENTVKKVSTLKTRRTTSSGIW